MTHKSDVKEINNLKKNNFCLKISAETQKKKHRQKKKEKQRIKICNMKTQTKKAEVKTALKKIISLFITIDTLLNEILYAHTLIDLGCLYFSMVIKKTVEQNKLKQFSVSL